LEFVDIHVRHHLTPRACPGRHPLPQRLLGGKEALAAWRDALHKQRRLLAALDKEIERRTHTPAHEVLCERERRELRAFGMRRTSGGCWLSRLPGKRPKRLGLAPRVRRSEELGLAPRVQSEEPRAV
jgi:hypothetical protein